MSCKHLILGFKLDVGKWGGGRAMTPCTILIQWHYPIKICGNTSAGDPQLSYLIQSKNTMYNSTSKKGYKKE